MPLGNEPLLDTNALIAWLANDPVLNQRYRGRDVAISSVSLGELYYGAANSKRQDENERHIEKQLAYCEVVVIDEAIARAYGQAKAALRAAGKPIPDNDLWIAATAIETGLTLVSRDQHFHVVPGLSVTAW